ncbi:MAG: hypothetical protein TE42_08455 [Candidatus Synechococcus spongiarum SP3]|uniref:Uncharacterized protein n=1 Tax=Candidatus Synechococcus spongiarum SP3 TaxID=1604020 RepID=A0A0G2HJR2_9SYNE|nr:MAG: hypothetical protein TE42_08455 [Candidatus Synechococcus spongiarum SP3]
MAPSTPPVPSPLATNWLKPAAGVGGLALLLAAFHGVWQEIHGLREELKTDIQAVETRLRFDLSELTADYGALNNKLDRVLEGLLQP